MQERPGADRLDRFVANPRRALWLLAMPILIGMSIQTLYMIVDMFFVGRVSPEALTALAFNMPLVFLAMGVTFGLGTGITAVIAQAIGARDRVRADCAAEHAVLIGGLVAALTTGSALGFGVPLLHALGVPEELVPQAWSYFRVLACGYPFMVLAVFFRSILSGEGNVKTPVMIQGAATLLNIALDPLFIFTFGMGVAGAALATIVSQAVAALAFIYLLFIAKLSYVRFNLRNFQYDPAIARSICVIGLPASLSFLVMSMGGGLFNRILVEHTPDAVAALQIGSRLDHVVILPQVAVASGLVTLVGMFYGARRGDLLREIITYAMLRTILLSLAVAAAFYALAPSLVAFFTDSPGIRSLGVDYLRVVVFAYPFIGISILTGRSLQGLGRGSPELWLSLLRVILISAPLAWAVTFWLRLPVQWVWYSSLVGTVISASIALLWLTIGVRTAIDTVGSGPPPLGDRPGAAELSVEAAAEAAEPA